MVWSYDQAKEISIMGLKGEVIISMILRSNCPAAFYKSYTQI